MQFILIIALAFRSVSSFNLGVRITPMKKNVPILEAKCDTSRISVRMMMSTVLEEEKEVIELSPAEEEAELVQIIKGRPKLGVLGFFDEASRTDQFVLDCLHAQGAWGSIVAFASDTAAAKKKLMSRSARYSGLLDALQFESAPKEHTQEKICSMLSDAGVKAWLAFEVDPNEAGIYLKAAEDAGVEHVVIVTKGTSESVLPSESTSLQSWTIIELDVDALVDDVPEGGPVAINRVPPTDDKSIARADAYRIAAEAFALKPAINSKFKISNGGEIATKYLRSLREAGFTRRGELAKLVNGGLDEFEAKLKAEEEAQSEEAQAATIISEEERQKEYKQLMEEGIREEREKREREITQAARDYLGRQWTEKKYSSARGLSKEEYIEIEWDKGVKEAAAILGYTTKDKLRGIVKDEDEDDDDDDDDDD